ncbi:hypothetical protein HMPREF3208_00879 [Gardnerella vaginalis]|uniref:Uncharacterized protein n=1 Tax=Gardnerella vaginalis TaxID=2702 RepID=A0A133NUS0_GARVA|nr:hypothetical protein HMPREF3208_00879 [Gardnerella vaginalis]
MRSRSIVCFLACVRARRPFLFVRMPLLRCLRRNEWRYVADAGFVKSQNVL